MNNNGWQHLQSLFHATLSLNEEERAAYLTRACEGDAELRQKVESLIAASEHQEDFLEQPTFSLGMQVLIANSTEDLTNQLIGSFKILSRLGNGGMGDVYLAEDTQLGRKVALKFLSGKFADNQWAKRQFTKEAQAVAMLDHPNICAVHGLEEANGHTFIVMQYVEGERLDELIENGKCEPHDAVALSIQTARALAEAHAHGIIHRDIKPSNIMVTANGQVKVLDFGLAKLVEQHPNGFNDKALSKTTSQLGFIPGTIAYMSPEQLRGERLDCLTDIFSFGVVIYELLSGRHPFARDSKAETISTILVSQPQSLRRDAPNIPRELERIVQKCFEKDKSARYQSSGEVLFDLEEFQKKSESAKHTRWYPDVRSVAALTFLLLLMTVAVFAYGYLNKQRTIAILPMLNETGDASLDYLGDGLTESLINKLTGLSKLRVKAFGIVSGYRGQQIDPQKIGRELDTDFVVTGKLTGTKASLWLQIAVINTDDGSQIWNNRYGVGLEELFQTEDDVAGQIITKLELWSGGDKAKILGTPRPQNPEAYNQYINGRYLWRTRDKENVRKAIENFKEAIRLDSKYAQAYAGLADCYVLVNMPHYGDMSTAEVMTKAEEAASEAVALNDQLPEAHTALGGVYMKWNWNWRKAEAEFKRAIELNYEYAAAHYQYSNLLTITGRLPEALNESAIAVKLDPFSTAANMNHCRVLYYQRDYDQATVCFQHLVKEDSSSKNYQYMMGLIYLRRGAYQDATTIFESLYANDRKLAGAALGYTYGVTGRRDDALRVVSELEAQESDDSYISPQEFAFIYIGLGDNDRAFSLLRKAAAERYSPLTYMEVEPLFDSIRSDARFTDLARSLNLPAHP